MKLLLLVLSIVFIEIFAFPQENPFSFDESHEISNPFNTDLIQQTNKVIQSNGLMSNGGKWSSDFTIPGILGNIYTSATDGTNLYIGGNFEVAGSTIAKSIVKWDGQKWSPIGEGLENGVSGDIPSVHAIAYADGKLFVGGQFTKAGTVEVNGIAYWDGSSWNKLGNDSINGVRQIIPIENDTLIIKGSVWSLFVHNDKIYIGGWFQLAGENPTNGIVAWNIKTETWETMKGGFESIHEHDQVSAYSYVSDGNDIYVGGKFDFAGGVPVKNIALWDGVNWSPAGEAAGIITDLKYDQKGNLYAVGYFHPGENPGACGIGKWDGTNWTSIPGPEGYISSVSCIEILNDELYAGGYFEIDEYRGDFSFAKWDGDSWLKIERLDIASNELIEGFVNSIVLVNNKLFVAGSFTKAGEIFPVNIAEWDYTLSKWKLLDDGSSNKGIHDGYIQVLEKSGNIIYAGGSFTVAGGIQARHIAKWKGNKWESLGEGNNNGVNGNVYTILIDNNDVFVGGYFGIAGTEATFHVAKWDGSKWHPIGMGVGGVPGAHVRALAKVDNFLYVAGYFSVVGDEENYMLPANSIARFNLTTNRWETLGRGIEYIYEIPGRVYDLEVYGDKILVGGEFYNADGNFYENFAVLSNNKWSGINADDDIGIEGIVKKIKIINNEIYIGGVLRLDHMGESYGLLKWDEKKWIGVGERLTASIKDVFVNDIVPYDSGLIAGGLFEYAGNSEVNNLAYFNGIEWESVGYGILPGISNMAIMDNLLFVSGPQKIYTSGGLSLGIAQFELAAPDHTNIDVVPDVKDFIRIYPNPASESFTIDYELPNEVNDAELELFDMKGSKVKTYPIIGNSNNLLIKTTDLRSGIYLYRIKSDQILIASNKILINKK